MSKSVRNEYAPVRAVPESPLREPSPQARKFMVEKTGAELDPYGYIEPSESLAKSAALDAARVEAMALEDLA